MWYPCRLYRNAPGSMAALASPGVSREFGGFDSPKVAAKPRRVPPTRHEPELAPLRVPASRRVGEEEGYGMGRAVEEERLQSTVSRVTGDTVSQAMGDTGASSAASVHLEHLFLDEAPLVRF